jgi:uncharacterized protein YfbU (UPF0304 family)
MTDYKTIHGICEDIFSLNYDKPRDFFPESLRVLDFDHTVAFTSEKVGIKRPDGKIVKRIDSSQYSHHRLTQKEIDKGFAYDFSEFDDVDVDLASENKHVTKILRNFVQAETPCKRVILILTARNQEAEAGIRSYLETIGIDHSSIDIVGVGSSSSQKKINEIAFLLDKYKSIASVSFFDDSSKNTDSMVKFLNSYNKSKNREIVFDVAKVEVDGKLVRLPGYRTRRK